MEKRRWGISGITCSFFISPTKCGKKAQAEGNGKWQLKKKIRKLIWKKYLDNAPNAIFREKWYQSATGFTTRNHQCSAKKSRDWGFHFSPLGLMFLLPGEMNNTANQQVNHIENDNNSNNKKKHIRPRTSSTIMKNTVSGRSGVFSRDNF